MKPRIYIFGVLFIIIVMYIGSCRKAGVWLVKTDEPEHADAIVILMGSITDRILQAVDLYQSGIGGKLIIVEASNDGYGELRARGADMISGTRQVSNAAVALGIPTDRIIVLPGGAQSTQQEALIIREYLENKPEIDTLILVTSSPHTRRAKVIFENVFKKSAKRINVFCSPNNYSKFNADKWWQSKDNIETVLMEYVKMTNFLLFDKKEIKQKYSVWDAS